MPVEIGKRVWGCACVFSTMALFASPAVATSLSATEEAQPPSPPIPSETEMARLVWSTLLAVDQANLSGNYSVLRDISASGFQANNDQAKLAQIFAGLRASWLDLSTTLLAAPSFAGPPRYVQPNLIEARGVFPIRPIPIRFDVLYLWEQGRWKLFGVQILPVESAPAAPAAQKPAETRR